MSRRLTWWFARLASGAHRERAGQGPGPPEPQNGVLYTVYMMNTQQGPEPEPDHPPYWSASHPEGCPQCIVCADCFRPRPRTMVNADQVCWHCVNK